MKSDTREVALEACIENSLAGAVRQFEDSEEGVQKESVTGLLHGTVTAFGWFPPSRVSHPYHPCFSLVRIGERASTESLPISTIPRQTSRGLS